MAITPKAILDSFTELTDDERHQVDRLEALVDQHLAQNYWEDGVVTYNVPDLEPINLNQARELANRYRQAGWRVQVFIDEPYTTLVFSKGVIPNPDVTQIRGKAN